LIRRNPHGVEPRWAVDITLQILDGLAHAHARDFIHRDIKESNLLVDATDRAHLKVKIADFGLAKSYEMLGASGFTRTDDVPALAPWSDLYATGAVLHRLLTGQHTHDVRPHRVSSSLAAVAERAMRKDPTRRFRNAIEMRQALLAVTDAPQAGDQVAAHTGRSRR
jgi:serine/threonine protein kinase